MWLPRGRGIALLTISLIEYLEICGASVEVGCSLETGLVLSQATTANPIAVILIAVLRDIGGWASNTFVIACKSSNFGIILDTNVLNIFPRGVLLLVSAEVSIMK